VSKNEDDILETLVEKAKAHDLKSFDKILSILNPELKKMATKYYINGSDAEDVLQEARIGVWKAVEDWQPSGGMSFKNFAINLCCKRHIITAMATANRKKYTILNQSISYEIPIITNDPSDTEQSLADFIEDPNSELINHFISRDERETRHRRILSKLTNMERSIYLYFMQDLSYREIAENLGIKTKAVDNALMRIRKKAAEVMNEIDEENN